MMKTVSPTKTKGRWKRKKGQPTCYTVSPEHRYLLHETKRGKVLRLVGPTPTLQCHHPQDPDLEQLRCRPEVWGPYAKAIDGQVTSKQAEECKPP